MVPRPGSTTPEDGMVIKQEPEAGAPSIGRTSVASELEDRPVASWSSEGTFTTGHGASDEREGYEEPFAVPDVAPPGAITDFDGSYSPPGLKPAKAEDQPSTPARAKPARRKPKKKKKLRAPESDDEARTELFKKLEQYPILAFLKPKLIGKLTGPFHEPELAKLASERLTIQTLFTMLRESGFVLGVFEMERLYDWDLESWKDAIRTILSSLIVLVGTIKPKTPSIQDTEPRTQTPLPTARYASSDDSDSSVESTKRMPMRRTPRVMQLTTKSAELEARTPDEAVPKALEEAIIRLMQSTRMQGAPGTTQRAPTDANQNRGFRRQLPDTAPQETADIAMESVSSHSPPGGAAAVSTATAGTSLARVRLSAFSELKEFNGRDASEKKARAWFNRLKSASRRDAMTGDESWTELTDQFRIQYCGKGVSMASRYYHASKHTDETPLKYLYRLNVTGMRAKIHYADGSPEEKREHVELFINTLGAQELELASRLTLMEVPDAATLEKKLHARQRGLAHQRKTLFGSNKFRQKPPATTPSPSRAVHAVQMAADEFDSGREEYSSNDQLCEQDRDEEDRARLFVTGHAPPGENPRRE
ncbi:Eukaryotic/viral aspartic protease, partial [Phytophthora megakarya]